MKTETKTADILETLDYLEILLEQADKCERDFYVAMANLKRGE